MARPAPYSYSDAGYNGFFRRTLLSNPSSGTLRQVPRSSQQLRFEDLQISGALGDKFTLGRIVLDGANGRMTISDGQNIRAIIGFEQDGF